MNLPFHDMPWYFELYFLMKLILAFLAGGVIGLEREKVGKEAGIRTFGLICMGACSYTILSEAFLIDTSARIVANIVVGMGFIAGGVIYRAGDGRGSHGLTTASSLWVSSSVGVMIGYGRYTLALGLTILTVLALHLPSAKIWKYLSKKYHK